jgi:hypothetical protein
MIADLVALCDGRGRTFPDPDGTGKTVQVVLPVRPRCPLDATGHTRPACKERPPRWR